MQVRLDGAVLREGIDLTATCIEFNQYLLSDDNSFVENIDFG